MSGLAEKRIYLAGRHPSLSQQDFVRRWRGHFELASSRPRWRNIRRYWQYDPFPEAQAAGHDAIAQLWFRSPEAAQRHFLETDDQAVMEADEREIFSEMIRDRIVAVTETVVRDGPIGSVVLFRFLRRRPGVKFAAFAASYASYCRKLSLRLPTGLRFVCNVDAEGGERSRGLDVDAIDEMHFPDLASASGISEVLGAGALPEDAVLVASVLTRPIPLYEIDNSPAAPPASAR